MQKNIEYLNNITEQAYKNYNLNIRLKNNA